MEGYTMLAKLIATIQTKDSQLQELKNTNDLLLKYMLETTKPTKLSDLIVTIFLPECSFEDLEVEDVVQIYR